MVEIYIIELANMDAWEAYSDKLLKMLPISIQERFTLVRRPAKRISSLVAAAAVQIMGQQKLQVHQPLQIEYTLQGKPFFKDFTQLHFNVSHSANYICVGFCEQPLGIDVEKNRKCNWEIVERFLHPQEIAHMQQIEDENERGKYFTKIWSLKESYVKYNGQGIANQFKEFFVGIENNGIVHSQELNVHFALLSDLQEYQLSVCTQLEYKIKTTQLSLSDFEKIATAF